MEKLISVIIPVYNVEEYVGRCIESVIGNSYRNLEIICVDDGSKDNSGKICDRYAIEDNRIQVIHKENGGLSSTRNVGLSIASGELIAFIDSDDWVHQKYFEVLVKCLQDNNSDMAVCSYIRTKDENGLPKIDSDSAIQTRNLCRKEVASSHETKSYVWGRIYKRELIENIYFDEQEMVEDAVFNSNVFVAKKELKAVYVNAPLYAYFIREGSLISGFNAKTYLNLCEKYYLCACEEQDAEMREIWALESVKRGLSAGYFFEMDGSIDQAKNSYKMAGRCVPMIREKKWLYNLMTNVPILYRMFRAVNDPDLLRWEIRRLFRIDLGNK